jgi:hypothetical protein
MDSDDDDDMGDLFLFGGNGGAAPAVATPTTTTTTKEVPANGKEATTISPSELEEFFCSMTRQMIPFWNVWMSPSHWAMNDQQTQDILNWPDEDDTDADALLAALTNGGENEGCPDW